MIPGMFRQKDDTLFKVLPKSGCIEGARLPLGFVDTARFFFEKTVVYLIPEKQACQIIMDEGWRK